MTEAYDRTRVLAEQEGSGSMGPVTPEGLAKSQKIALRTTLTPQTIGIALGTEVAGADEEINPEGVQVIRYIEVDDREINDYGVDENAGSTPLGITDIYSGFDVIIPGTPHTDPDGDMMS